jgi:prevent-host-death family protein
MASNEIPFSKARGNLTSILDRVEKTGEAVTILRRGRPSAVIVSLDMFERKLGKPKRAQWRLAGSIRVRPGVDVDAALARGRAKVGRALKERNKRG